MGISETVLKPQFNPLDPDIELQATLADEDEAGGANEQLRGHAVGVDAATARAQANRGPAVGRPGVGGAAGRVGGSIPLEGKAEV
mgnify:CR=1 FL=1